MKKFKGLMTSLSCEYSTPQWLFDELNKEFHFTIDVCATHKNAKCDHYWDKEIDGLLRDWFNHVCWLTPPLWTRNF